MRNKFILVAAACCTLLAASAAGSAGSGEASPAPAPEKKWLVPEAEYRLSVQPELPAEARQKPAVPHCLPTCLSGLTSERGNWQEKLMKQEPED